MKRVRLSIYCGGMDESINYSERLQAFRCEVSGGTMDGITADWRVP
jgi:hypothetical protein